MKASESTVVRALQLGCVALVAAMALNAPSPNGGGGWRDQFVDGYRQAQADDEVPPATEGVDPSVAAEGTGGGS